MVVEQRWAAVVVVEVVQQYEEGAGGGRGRGSQQLVVEEFQQGRGGRLQVGSVGVSGDRHLSHVHVEGTVQDLINKV